MADSSKIQELSLEEIMGDRFGRYSKYIIQERALPDVRDGLKPVQRRILYAMHVDGNTFDKAFRKSAKSVGNVMGNFHPHGDTPIYEALVRLSQSWKLRVPLIEMHGNNGSMDGDPPAAMRYTEARLSKASEALLQDIEKDVVDMVLNFDDTLEEPTVLPARFPNLLVNGATGISAGYATEIPPHNLGEVIDATIALIDNPELTLDEAMQYVQGPDFPTGGILQGKSGIKKAYQTGRGKVILRSKTKIQELRGHRSQIIVTEIPYEVNKALLVKKIDEIRLLKTIDGIAEVRDESDRHGLSIVIELKRDVNAQAVLNYLFKNTDLQVTYNFNMVAIAKMRPQQLGLLPILKAYIDHQKEVVLRRTNFDLDKAQKRLHIVDGLIKALSILDQVIHTIRASKNKSDAVKNLVAEHQFSKEQASAIVALQLYRLTNTDVTQLQKEQAQLQKSIIGYQAIIANPKQLLKVIKQELQAIKKEFATPRLTKIEAEVAEIKIDRRVMVTEETVRVLVSRQGYLKRSSLRSYQASTATDNGLRPEDNPILDCEASTLDHLYIFTNQGHLIYRPIHELDDVRWKDTGQHLSQTIGLNPDEEILNAFVFKDLKGPGKFLFATTDGYIKQVKFADLLPGRTYRSRAIKTMKLHSDNSKILRVFYLSESNANLQVIGFTEKSYALRFSIEEIPIVRAQAAGVKFMSLKDQDQVVDYDVVDPSKKQFIIILTQRGAFKKMELSELSESSRARRGVLTLRELKNKPHRIKIARLLTNDEILKVMTTNAGEIDIDPSEFNFGDRYSNGSFVIDLEKSGTIEQAFINARPTTSNNSENKGDNNE
ncbi:MAG: DNA topoisomerase IV subunit A [Lactobacillus sp.]|uniref:DNA topoisomerase IV subunit A n=1 Tax=Bombilactobacillus bombi TaxID=1303590 RepID=UPI000E59225C|nr:DNA topoisomerase IV subunit A [Bombilactobacillus bombi]AXX64554.1 DNA topoisomerase IV subunit A [Bombilactobacillus bombi]MCO6542885.1 DNA topoisomerase IV subunit A [Lactobacillus sp.]